jgi:hypothetical protein
MNLSKLGTNDLACDLRTEIELVAPTASQPSLVLFFLLGLIAFFSLLNCAVPADVFHRSEVRAFFKD